MKLFLNYSTDAAHNDITKTISTHVVGPSGTKYSQLSCQNELSNLIATYFSNTPPHLTLNIRSNIAAFVQIEPWTGITALDHCYLYSINKKVVKHAGYANRKVTSVPVARKVTSTNKDYKQLHMMVSLQSWFLNKMTPKNAITKYLKYQTTLPKLVSWAMMLMIVLN